MPTGPTLRLVALALTGEERRQLAANIASTTQLCHCARAGELLALASQPDASAVVAGLRDVAGVPTGGALLALRREWPALPIVVIFSLTPADLRATLDLVHRGLQATWVIRHFEGLDAAVARVLASAPDPGPEAAILEAVGPHVPPSALPFVVFAAAAASRPVSVAEAARALGIGPRALELRLRRAGLPPPARC